MALKNIADLIGFQDSQSAQDASRKATSGKLPVSIDTTAVRTTREVSSGATESSRLLQVVSRYVPSEVLPHLCFVRLEDRQLRLIVSNAAAATRRRFSGRQVKQGLAKAEGLQVDKVSVHVKPSEEAPYRQRRTKARPAAVSESTIKLIESAAASAEKSAETDWVNGAANTSDAEPEKDPLATALKRLAQALATRR